MISNNNKIKILSAVSICFIVAVFCIKRFAQNSHYHLFSDNIEIFAIPNFNNVISNFPFIVFGIIGITFIIKKHKKNQKSTILLASLFFFLGIFFTGIGSSYYHLYPNTNTLVWDRLPMVIVFMSFFSSIITENISNSLGKKSLVYLLIIGVISVLYWYITELFGIGDLRLYVIVQFLPLILIPLILLMFNNLSSSNKYYWFIIGIYILAKIFETFDEQIYLITNVISGHTIKHLVASIAPFIYYRKLSYLNKN